MVNKNNPNADLDGMSRNELYKEHTRLLGLIVGTPYDSKKYHEMNKRADVVCLKLELMYLIDGD